MRRFAEDDFSDLEAELREGRAEPDAELLPMLLARIESRPDGRRRPRFALALAFATVMLGAFAAFGGVGYAKSSVVDAAKNCKQVAAAVVHHSGNGRIDRQTQGRDGSNGKSNDGSGSSGKANTGKGNDGNDDKGSNGTGSDGKGNGDGNHGNGTHHDRVVYKTIVVPSDSVKFFVPPGTLGPCRGEHGHGSDRQDIVEASSSKKGGDHDDPPWMHQYHRFVLVCFPFVVHGR